MELDLKPSFERHSSALETSQADGKYVINLYRTPPFGTLTLEESEDLFRQRLEALMIMERTDMTGEKFTNLSNILREIKSYVYKTNCILLRTNDPQQRKQDHFSHMLARMYCVYHPQLWDWFKYNEKKLLRYRLKDQAHSISADQFEAILKSFNFEFERVRGADLNKLIAENLIGWNRRDPDREDIFKVKFTVAIKFIANRSVSLKDGYAFLTRHEIIQVVCDVFENHLEEELLYARQHFNVELQQTQQLLDSLRVVYEEYSEKLEDEKRKAKSVQDGEQQSPFKIDIDNLGEISKNHFPPCIQYMHEALMEDHHLKHQGRLIYGAFLRSGGVDLESAIEFWRKEFTKKIPNDKFERDYKYNIRHLYGKEGHKKALTCFSCDKIINDNPPGPSEKHGCPFKHFDDTHLKALLKKHGYKDVDIESLVLHRREGDSKLTCSHYFKLARGDFPTEPIKNPIHFYYESRRFAMRPVSESKLQDGDEDKFDDD